MTNMAMPKRAKPEPPKLPLKDQTGYSCTDRLLTNLLYCTPPGYQMGDIYKELIPKNYVSRGPNFMVERAKELMESKDPMCYGDVTYKDFCNDKDRVELLEALCVGDEDFVRKALALKPGQDGLYLNLNCCPQHPEMPALAYEYGVNNEMPYKPAREDQRRLAIGDEGVAILAKCLPKTGLRSLIVQLSRNKITHKGFKAFAAAIPSDVEDLKLYFHANSIGDRGACSIAWKIKNMKKLKSLYMCLGCNEIHDQGNQMIAECLPATLEHYSLMMRWNPTMDEQTVGRSVMYDASHRLPKIPTGLDASRFYLLY